MSKRRNKDIPRDATAPGASTEASAETSAATEMNAREFGRWIWRQWTSMRTALLLLLLLALAAVPGSVIPQENIDMSKVSKWKDAHPDLAPVYEKLGLFDVYSSPWFSAIYLLLVVSLIGCIVPRLRVYAKAMRARPVKAPRNLTRFSDNATYTTDEDVDVVVERARALLKKRRFRVDVHDESAANAGTKVASVSSERGYLREAGNLLFHFSILVVMVGFALGSLFGYQGGVLLQVGNGFSNNLTQYDEFSAGGLYDADDMPPFSFDLTDFDAEWLYSGAAAGQARKFVSKLEYTEEPGGEQKSYDLRVNHPLNISGTDIFLIGHGYAPVVTVRDSSGEAVYSGPTIFLPLDQTFRSMGVIKAPDAEGGLAFEGELYPTYEFDMDHGPYSSHGSLIDPKMSLLAYTGDLGLDAGVSQSVYILDKAGMEKVLKADGSDFRVDISPGETVKLPDGQGSISFDGIVSWNKLQISHTPGKLVALAGVVLALIGMIGSLYVRPRRIWVRARRTEEGTLVEIGGLDRSSGGDVSEELEEIRAALAPATSSTPSTLPAETDPVAQETQQSPQQAGETGEKEQS
ncbi:cytochrome c biogenesis protein ResB [Nocardioides yefusunii]|uniref:Cytochrome c biogenesis protein ResB n=1 Tax=Nocardioides yefusunii TaxID=2500546 RepID=A0ABW1QZS7_9ACTN|nr:cytochrome c biogenesis protein ResB [Nocardioides yefusunii]